MSCLDLELQQIISCIIRDRSYTRERAYQVKFMIWKRLRMDNNIKAKHQLTKLNHFPLKNLRLQKMNKYT